MLKTNIPSFQVFGADDPPRRCKDAYRVALHHLFPSLPYHNLDLAHRKLMTELPVDSPYRLTNSDSLWQSLVRLWRASHQARQKNYIGIGQSVSDS